MNVLIVLSMIAKCLAMKKSEKSMLKMHELTDYKFLNSAVLCSDHNQKSAKATFKMPKLADYQFLNSAVLFCDHCLKNFSELGKMVVTVFVMVDSTLCHVVCHNI